MYGIYNTMRKEFQFGICEPTAKLAEEKLYNKIGKDSYKWRFKIKELTQEEELQIRQNKKRRKYNWRQYHC